MVWAVVGLFLVLLASGAILLRHLDEARRDSAAQQRADVEARAHIAAIATTNLLETSTGSIPDDIVRAQRLLTRLSMSGDLEGVQLGLYLVPRVKSQPQAGLLVASSPTHEFERTFGPLAGGSGLDVLALLKSMCGAEPPLPQPSRWSYASQGQILSLLPVTTRSGCWGVVTLRHDSFAIAPASLSILPPLDLSNPTTSLILLLGGLLAMIALFHSRQLFQFLRGETAWQPATPAHATAGTAPSFAVGPALTSRHAIIHRAQESEALGRDALEELAHGLKTPVATIIQSLEPLRHRLPSDDPSAMRSLQIIETASRRLIDLIQAIPGRSAGMIESPGGHHAAIGDIVHAALSSLDSPQHDVDLRVVDMTDGAALLSGEARLLRGAVEHIVENALDFSPPGGEVCVRVTAGRSVAILAIEDEGPGVTPDLLPRIFDRYFSDRRTAPRAQGQLAESTYETPNFGLGLWIARRNIEALHGRICAENRRSGGLRVTMSLPIGNSSDA